MLNYFRKNPPTEKELAQIKSFIDRGAELQARKELSGKEQLELCCSEAGLTIDFSSLIGRKFVLKTVFDQTSARRAAYSGAITGMQAVDGLFLVLQTSVQLIRKGSNEITFSAYTKKKWTILSDSGFGNIEVEFQLLP